MQRTSQRLSRYLPLVLWMIFISIASTGEFSGDNTSRIVRPVVLWLFPGTSEATLQIIHFAVRKAAHLTEYAVLGFLAGRAFATSSHDLLRRRWVVLVVILIVVYALLDEYHQAYVPSRTASVFDSLLDSVGGLGGLLVYYRRREQP
jgi:VanZ family protein